MFDIATFDPNFWPYEVSMTQSDIWFMIFDFHPKKWAIVWTDTYRKVNKLMKVIKFIDIICPSLFSRNYTETVMIGGLSPVQNFLSCSC